MSAQQIIELHQFGRWARNRLLEAIPAVDRDDPFTRPVADLGTIRAKFVHIMSAELVWIDRIGFDAPSRSATGMLSEEDVPDRSALKARWVEIDGRYDRLFAAVSEGGERGSNAPALDRLIDYKSLGGAPFQSTLREMLMHVALHGMYHRGQIATILSRLGGPTVSTDLIAYYRKT
ncbi:DinB family protein [Leptonema illini]|uniref:DinB family protein n=1 Tax=Leptonema illini DSM 21528 TaxID=929563 RepID=H2CCI0_9LEPT|nr:DinB family protein [Leptonema illini]EHQ07440.1 DinB family protein [Leptonema illini DSM 21528]PKL32962.1 MAG: hypothetical protein CVV45_10035 [Spirochaetae bacterium HGW-Spirochaetae-10]